MCSFRGILDVFRCPINRCTASSRVPLISWGLRDYRVNGQIGLEQSPDAYVATMVEVFREVGRVLRDDGTVWLNLGSSYASASQGRSSSKVREQLGEIGSEFSVKFMPNADLPFALRDESVFISGGHRKV